MLLLYTLLSLLLPTVAAISIDEAGVVDHHLQLLGPPSNESTFFHPPVAGSKASLLYTLSDKSVLGAIKPKDGSVVWRQRLRPAKDASHRGKLVAGDEQDTVVTAVGTTITAWSAADGRFVWETKFAGQRISDLRRLEIPEGRTGSYAKDLVVIAKGKQTAVVRLNAETGSVLWRYEEQSGDAPLGLSASGSHLYLVTAHKAMLKGLKLKVTCIDHKSGKMLDQNTLTSDGDLSASSDVLAIGAVPARPIIAWVDATRRVVKVNVLGAKNIASFDINSASANVDKVQVIGTSQVSAQPHFLLHYHTSEDHWAQVFHVDPKQSSVTKAYDLPKLKGEGVFSASAINANVYFTRTTTEELTLVSSASHDVLGKWPIKAFIKSSGERKRIGPAPFPVHSATEVVSRATGSFAVRSAVLLSTGEWALVQNGDISWTRPEMLASIKKAEWVKSAEIDGLAEELEVESHAGGIFALYHRMRRHVHQLQDLPNKLKEMVYTATQGIEALIGKHNNAQLQAKLFGFDRKVVAETTDGYIVVLDPSSNNRVELQLKAKPEDSGFSLNEQLAKALDHNTTAEAKAGADSQAVKPFISYVVLDGALHGVRGMNGVWRYVLPENKKLVSITSPLPGERVASIGKVLGDRSVLYKYLNPNAILVMAADEKQKLLEVTLLDSTSGVILYSTSHQAVDLSHSLSAVVTENWFVYSFTSDARRENQSRGHQLVAAELYESELPNDRGPLGSFSNYSTLSPPVISVGPIKPHVVTQSFHVSEEISKMIVTQTTQGITSRDLIVILADSNGIVSIPHRAFDPRRPVDKDPTSTQMEEGLMRYYPLIEFDARSYITHKNEVAGIENIIITPSAMESTSLVFAYGLDVFSTRVNPSFSFDILGSNFNKHSLILTVVALTAAAFAVSPFVQKKRTNALWQNN